MLPETAKRNARGLSREELIALIYEMAKRINELEEELARTTQPPPRDFKTATSRKRKRSKRKGAQPRHESQSAFQKLLQLMGQPIWPFLHQPSFA